MQRLDWFALSIVGSSAIALLPAHAEEVDLRTLVPAHSTLSSWVDGSVSPDYHQINTEGTLSITNKGLIDYWHATHNYTPWSVEGDFTATVAVSMTQWAGGGLTANFADSTSWTSVTPASFEPGKSWVGGQYGLFSGGGVNLPTSILPSVDLVLKYTREGNVLTGSASYGGRAFVDYLSLSGSAVDGPAVLGLQGWTEPGHADPATVTYSHFSVTAGASASLKDLVGGTSEAPAELPSTSIGSLSGAIGGDGPTSQYFTFNWQGGNFLADVGIPDADWLTGLPGYKFQLYQGPTAGDLLTSVSANSTNNWSNRLSYSLAAGTYTLGILETGASNDPTYSIIFGTPLNGKAAKLVYTPTRPVPDEAQSAVLGLSALALLGIARRHSNQRRPATSKPRSEA